MTAIAPAVPTVREELRSLGITPDGVTFSTRDVPWAKQGTIIDRPVTTGKAMELAGLGFRVRKDEVASRAPGGEWEVIPNRVAITREDTGERFDVASTEYEPVQYEEVFGFMDKVAPHIVAAGPLMGGRQAFVVAQRPDLAFLDMELHGEAEPHQMYAVLRTSHDRSRAVEAGLLALNGRCMNALTLKGFLRGAEQRWSIRHTRKAKEHLAQATSVWSNLGVYAQEYQAVARRLADVDLDVEAAKQVLAKVLPDRPRTPQVVDTIVGVWQTSDTISTSFRRDGWGLTMAVSDYMEHGRDSGNVTPQSRFLGALQGPTHRLVNRTAALLLTRS
jgi:phage/plasmid-like protein (TIGR03299 family)